MTTTDTTAFTALVERHGGELHRHCRRMLGSATDADDAVQEALLRAWRSRHTLRDRTAGRAWLYRIATNACHDTLARRRPADGDAALEALPADRRREPHTATESALSLAFAVQHLPPRQRTVLVLTDVLGWRAKEVAELLGDSVPAVRSALQRARAGVAPHLAA